MKIRKSTVIIAGVLLAGFAAVFLVLRSTELSNLLKRTIFEEFQSRTGYQITADRIFFNPFPFFIEGTNIKILAPNGEGIFEAKSIRGYIGLSEAFSKVVRVDRLVLTAAGAKLDEARIRDLEEKLKLGRDEAGKKRRGWKVKIKGVEVRDGAVYFADKSKGVDFRAEGLDGEALFNLARDFRVSAKRLSLAAPKLPFLQAKLAQLSGSIKDETLHLRKLSLQMEGTNVSTEGRYEQQKGGSLKTELELLPETLKKLFHLQGPGQGRVSVKGSIKFRNISDIRDALLDLKVKGDFYLQTLLELVKADTQIYGMASVSGHIKGPVRDFTASGTGSVKNGNIYGLPARRFDFKLNWARGVLALSGIKGQVYGGMANADFSITLPKVTRLALNVDMKGASTSGLLAFLKLKAPLPEGKVNGTLVSDGPKFMPSGHFTARTTVPGPDVTGRIKTFEGSYQFAEGDMIKLSGLKVNTGSSQITADGLVDMRDKTLSFGVHLNTDDAGDLTRPDFPDAKGKGTFDGTVAGPLEDPAINGRLVLSGAAVKGHVFGDVAADVSYSKDLLDIKNLQGKIGSEDVSVSGTISFPKAANLFDFTGPSFGLHAVMDRAPLQDMVKAVGLNYPVTGTASIDMTVRGTAPVISGELKVENGAYSGYSFSRADANLTYDKGKAKIASAVIRKGSSSIRFSGSIGADKQFDIKAVSDGLKLSEILPKPLPVDYRMTLRATGSGTFDNPVIHAEGSLSDGSFRGQSLQGGGFKAALTGRKLDAQLSLQGRRLTAAGSAELSGDMPWKADVDIKSGRYDQFLAGFLKELPRDLLLTLSAKGSFSGTRSSINGSLLLRQLTFAAYGQSFSSEKEARLTIRDKAITLNDFALRGGQASVNLTGDVVLGQSYNVDAEGRMSLAPVKAFVKSVELISGSASYVLHVGGHWQKPDISGGLSLSDMILGLKGMPQPVKVNSAYLYVDESKLVLDQMAGKIGGGDAGATGVVYLDGFRPTGFYFDVLLNNVSTNFSGIAATFSGNLVYRGDGKGRNLAGELNIRRASYKKDVELTGSLFAKRRAIEVKGVPTGAEATSLNVRVYGSDDISIKNNIARAPLSVDLTMRGTLAHPIPLGKIEAATGKIFFRNTEFDLQHASVIFGDPSRINPNVNVLASSIVKGYKITVSLAGTVDRFNLALTSDPHLDENDIFSLLAFGEFGENVKSAQGGIGAAEAAQFLTGKVQEVITERLKSLTGLDRFQVDPYISKTTGNITPRITVSKRLLGDKLFITYSAPVGTEEQVIRLEYALTKSISLIGVRDDLGSIGGDLTFRFEFK